MPKRLSANEKNPRQAAHPFQSKKGAFLASLRVHDFELCAVDASPRALFKTLPEGTLKAAQAAAKAAGSSDKPPHVFLRGQLLPSQQGAAHPWLWAGTLARGPALET